jgi:serine/threonine-protein kinase
MEYVRGVSLESIVEAHRRRSDRMPLCRALTILVEVAQGLAAVHAAGLVHRDIKPGNVVIEAESSRTVIVDFGLAEMRGREAISAGTPQYCAPEQFLGRTAAPTSDVYAFGVLAFELLTGRPPFEGHTISEMLEKHLLSDAPALSALVPELGPLDHIVARALEKSPSARYQRAEQLANDLLIARDTLFPPTSKRKPIATKLVERVLIAAPDASVRAVARRAVEEAFFWNPVEVSLADTVNAATTQAFEGQPGLILLGHDPKRFDGLAMLTALRTTTGGDRARVIAMADDATLAATRLRFGCLGVRDFLSTPLALRRVVEVIREATHRSGLFAAVNQDTALSDGSRQ